MQQPATDPENAQRNVLTLGEAAKALAVHKSTISRAIDDGRLSAKKEGNSYQIDPAELTRYRDHVLRKKSATVVQLPESDGQQPAVATPVDPLLEVERKERERERRQLQDVIDDLRKRLDKADAERERKELLLEDQRSRSEKEAERAKELEASLAAEKNKGFFARLFGS